MNVTKMVVCGILAVPMLSEAMPSKQDLVKVSPIVRDLMRPDQEAHKAGKKTRTEVADAALALINQANGEAAKLLLAKGAFGLYVRDGQFEKALGALRIMRTEVPDIPPQYLSNIIETSLKRVPKKNGGQLYRILEEAKMRAKFQNELKKLESQAKTHFPDKALQTRLAEHYAVLGDWSKALEAFARGADMKAAATAKSEQNGAKDAKAIADFWWGYSDKRGEEFEMPFKRHAAELYSRAIASEELAGLDRVQSERRIEEMRGLETIFGPQRDGLYCVIDLSGGPGAARYPISYMNEVPEGGWSDEYKTTKLVLRKIKAGRDPLGRYAISNDFFIGVFEVTQRQWELVMGNRPSFFSNSACYETRPVECVCVWQVLGIQTNKECRVADASFVGVLRTRTQARLDIPTMHQWEYACCAGRPDVLRDGKAAVTNDLSLCRCAANAGIAEYEELARKHWKDYYWSWAPKKTFRDLDATYGTAKVGSYRPNSWGLYDMLGNVADLCRYRDGSGFCHQGGSWLSDECSHGMSSHVWAGGRQHDANMGVRLIIDIPPAAPDRS